MGVGHVASFDRHLGPGRVGCLLNWRAQGLAVDAAQTLLKGLALERLEAEPLAFPA